MDIRPLAIDGSWVITPRQFADPRGVFLESFRQDRLAEVTGRPLVVRQTNVSVSSRGTVRGIHFADVPPGQAKYVTALAGSFIDYVVDIRVGSPTFGQWDSIVLDTVDRRAIYLEEGLGHCLCALEDDSTVLYLCSEVYNPTGEHGLHPLDPQIGLRFPADLEPLLSAKDVAAPLLADAVAAGTLPTWEGARAHAASPTSIPTSAGGTTGARS